MKYRNSSKKKGFTIIELIVSIGIFTVITGITLYKYGTFNNSLIVTNLAYQTALEIRQAQVYGLSVRGKDNDFSAGYGVHFDSRTDESKRSFWFFIDKDKNGVMTIPPPFTADNACVNSDVPECLEKITLQGRNTIEKFCLVANGSDSCPETGNLGTLDIIFKRPDPDAYITATLDGNIVQPGEAKNARIYIVSPDGKEKIVTVDQSGQISIQ